MNLFLYVFVTLACTCFPGTLLSITGKISQCYPLQSDFSNACNQTLGGVADGGRCFFLANGTQNWTDGWTRCKQSGGQMVQIQTEGEFNKIISYVKGVLGSSFDAWVALYDTQSNKTACTIDPLSTTWYDDVSTPNANLVVGNTWMRYHACGGDSFRQPPQRCFSIWKQGGSSFPYGIGDAYCYSKTYNTLCQFINQAQNFSKTNVCLTETPIESTTIGANPSECAQLCASRGWCRSFNFMGNPGDTSYTCQLFPWSIYDTCPNCANRVANNATCVHYNYVP